MYAPTAKNELGDPKHDVAVLEIALICTTNPVMEPIAAVIVALTACSKDAQMFGIRDRAVQD